MNIHDIDIYFKAHPEKAVFAVIGIIGFIMFDVLLMLLIFSIKKGRGVEKAALSYGFYKYFPEDIEIFIKTAILPVFSEINISSDELKDSIKNNKNGFEISVKYDSPHETSSWEYMNGSKTYIRKLYYNISKIYSYDGKNKKNYIFKLYSKIFRDSYGLGKINQPQVSTYSYYVICSVFDTDLKNSFIIRRKGSGMQEKMLSFAVGIASKGTGNIFNSGENEILGTNPEFDSKYSVISDTKGEKVIFPEKMQSDLLAVQNIIKPMSTITITPMGVWIKSERMSGNAKNILTLIDLCNGDIN